MLGKTDRFDRPIFDLNGKLYCYSEDHTHKNAQLEILIDLTSFWNILSAKSKLEDPDWWGHHDSDEYNETEADFKGYSEGCKITFEVMHPKGYRYSLATYDYNSMDLRMAQTRIDPVIDPANCIQNNIVKWLKINRYYIRNIVFPDLAAVERKKKLQAIARANVLKKRQS